MSGRARNVSRQVTFPVSRFVWQRRDISAEAKGTLIYLLSLPLDWNVRVKNIAREMGYGRDKQQRIFRELLEASYMDKEPDIDEDGNFRGWDYSYSDEPLPNTKYHQRKNRKRKVHNFNTDDLDDDSL